MNDDNEKLFGDKKIPFKVMMKRIGHYVIPEWKAFAFAFFLILLNVGGDILLPLIIKQFVDSVAVTETMPVIMTPLSTILGISFGWLALSVLSQHYRSDRDWVYYLRNIVDDYCSKIDMPVPEDYKLDLDDICDIANASLSNVHLMLLDETKKVIDQAMED